MYVRSMSDIRLVAIDQAAHYSWSAGVSYVTSACMRERTSIIYKHMHADVRVRMQALLYVAN